MGFLEEKLGDVVIDFGAGKGLTVDQALLRMPDWCRVAAQDVIRWDENWDVKMAIGRRLRGWGGAEAVETRRRFEAEVFDGRWARKIGWGGAELAIGKWVPTLNGGVEGLVAVLRDAGFDGKEVRIRVEARVGKGDVERIGEEIRGQRVRFCAVGQGLKSVGGGLNGGCFVALDKKAR